MRIINLTPHTVNLINDDGTVTTFPPSGEIARINVELSAFSRIEIDGKSINIFNKHFGMPSYVPPDEMPNVRYIVSAIYQSAFNRTDLLTPEEIVRDDSGNIIGCKSFSF